ncbi:Uncharacterized protein APZ42_017630 [Daphnia magna]|uniref:Uncharacterized protein n=1 Tax=Daphnia magna TaxID=35525 RepID=A0A0P5PFP6_9CRUS|nr:Uncharacterized protein APZ42_017630 [Daphnia magna]
MRPPLAAIFPTLLSRRYTTRVVEERMSSIRERTILTNSTTHRKKEINKNEDMDLNCSFFKEPRGGINTPFKQLCLE